jgi:hypothetical protein
MGYGYREGRKRVVDRGSSGRNHAPAFAVGAYPMAGKRGELGVTQFGKETTMAKVIGWIACCAFGFMVVAGIIYAASEFVDDVAGYRDNQ